MKTSFLALTLLALSTSFAAAEVNSLAGKVMNDLPADDFCDADRIVNPDRWFYWPNQTRFVMVGQCPNGDGVAIDTEENVGSIFYVCHEMINREKPMGEMVVKVADSPGDYVRKRGSPDFPWDFWEARKRGF